MELNLYVVRSQNGFLNTRGSDPKSSVWVNDLNEAMLYSKPGPAKGVATWLRKNSPDLASSVEVIDPTLVSHRVI